MLQTFFNSLFYKLCFKALPFTKFPFHERFVCVVPKPGKPLPKISHTFHYYSITMKYHAFKSLYTYSIGSALQVKLSNIVITGILVSSWFGRLFIFRRSTSSSFLSVLDDINNSIAHLYLPLEITIFHFEY